MLHFPLVVIRLSHPSDTQTRTDPLPHFLLFLDLRNARLPLKPPLTLLFNRSFIWAWATMIRHSPLSRVRLPGQVELNTRDCFTRSAPVPGYPICPCTRPESVYLSADSLQHTPNNSSFPKAPPRNIHHCPNEPCLQSQRISTATKLQGTITSSLRVSLLTGWEHWFKLTIFH